MLIYKILLLTLTISLPPAPLGVDWDKKHTYYPTIPEYRYYYGDIDWGEVIYIGNEDIMGMESEIQLFFHQKKIVKALLILGPMGINDTNCIKKYKKVRKLLTYKYGSYKYTREEKDPVAEDLITTSACYPFALGIHKITTYWTHGRYLIGSKLIGDEEGYYIEVAYTDNNGIKKYNKSQRAKIIKKL